MGYTRPVSVLRIKSTVKDKYSRMSVKKLLTMITPDGMLHNYYVDVSILLVLDNCDPPIAQDQLLKNPRVQYHKK